MGKYPGQRWVEKGSSGRAQRAPRSGSSMSRIHRRRGQDNLPSAGIVHEGSLTKFGYNLEEGEEKRHEALRKAQKEYGYAETIRKLAALEGVNKGKPNHAKVKSDIEYLQEHTYSREPSKDTAGGSAFVNGKGRVVYDHIPEGSMRNWG